MQWIPIYIEWYMIHWSPLFHLLLQVFLGALTGEFQPLYHIIFDYFNMCLYLDIFQKPPRYLQPSYLSNESEFC